MNIAITGLAETVDMKGLGPTRGVSDTNMRKWIVQLWRQSERIRLRTGR